MASADFQAQNNARHAKYRSAGREADRSKGAPKESPRGAGTSGGITVEDIRAVKGMVDTIGAEAVKELADVLSD